MDKPATLTCGTETSKDIKWKLNGEEVSFNGPNLNLLEVDTPDLGEYTCWRGEELISSTYLLLEAVEEQKLRNEQEGEMFFFHFSFNFIQESFQRKELIVQTYS